MLAIAIAVAFSAIDWSRRDFRREGWEEWLDRSRLPFQLLLANFTLVPLVHEWRALSRCRLTPEEWGEVRRHLAEVERVRDGYAPGWRNTWPSREMVWRLTVGYPDDDF